MHNKILFIIACIMFIAGAANALNFYEYDAPRPNPDDWETGTININSVLVLEGVFNKLGDYWGVRGDASNMNKLYSYGPINDKNNPWKASALGSAFHLNLGIKPVDWFYADAGLMFVGNYADRYYIPVNQPHRMDNEDLTFPQFFWARSRFKAFNDWASIEYNRGYGHEGWKEADGDLFKLFNRQDSPDNLLRVDGKAIPDFWRLRAEGKAGQFEAYYGEEVLENYKQGYYIKYKDIFGSGINFFYTDHIIPFGETDEERMRNFELSTDFNLFGANLALGGLYRPFRLDYEYTYIDNVAQGTGDDGSGRVKKTDTTGQKDALGGAVKLTIPEFLFLDLFKAGYEYRGLVAGNKNEITAGVEKVLLPTLTGGFNYTYTKPIIDAMPLWFSGVDGNGPPTFEPRGNTSPFWVWWRNENTGFDNRHASKMSFVFTYNPSPETPFYMYENNVVEEWNLNPDMGAEFSFATRINFERYFGGTDKQIYSEYDGQTYWENVNSAGAYATDGYIASLYWLGRLIKGRTDILVDFEIGQDLATSSYAYNASEPYLHSIIGYFKTSMIVKRDGWKFKVAYNKGAWGPENWHRTFGAVYDELYLAHVSKDVIENCINVGVEYAGARITDNSLLAKITETQNPPYLNNEMGYFDEILIKVKFFFNGVIKFGKEAEDVIIETSDVPPAVALSAEPATFTPSNNETGKLQPFVSSLYGVDRWTITIYDPTDKEVVREFTGIGAPPAEIMWDGKNNNGVVLAEDTYPAYLEAYDVYENYAATEQPTKITILNPIVIADAEVVETDTEIKITLGAKVLFDFDKTALKKGAAKTLKQVAGLLNERYPDNKIAIEGHTDSVGSHAYNDNLSMRRARAVQTFLKKEKVDAKRMIITGFGERKPVATNKNAKGREQNRRVEIIIRKDAKAAGEAEDVKLTGDGDTVEIDAKGSVSSINSSKGTK